MIWHAKADAGLSLAEGFLSFSKHTLSEDTRVYIVVICIRNILNSVCMGTVKLLNTLCLLRLNALCKAYCVSSR